MNTSSTQDFFANTRWSLVFDAGSSQSPRAENALNELCSRYWFPLYAYARHGGTAHADAEDLVQSFFISHFLKKNYLEGLDSEKGRFRAFLLACFKNHSANERKRARRQKRGGCVDHLPLEWATADEKLQCLVAAGTPEKMYDQAWIVTLLERVLGQLRQEKEAEGEGERFQVLKPSLALDGDKLSYQEVAKRLNMSEDATRQAMTRLRKRYRELICQEILQTCSPAQLEEEIRFLLSAFSD